MRALSQLYSNINAIVMVNRYLSFSENSEVPGSFAGLPNEVSCISVLIAVCYHRAQRKDGRTEKSSQSKCENMNGAMKNSRCMFGP